MSIWKPFSNVLDKQKIVLKTHLVKYFAFFTERKPNILRNKCIFKTIYIIYIYYIYYIYIYTHVHIYMYLSLCGYECSYIFGYVPVYQCIHV